MRAFSSSSNEEDNEDIEQGSTDASTRESGEQEGIVQKSSPTAPEGTSSGVGPEEEKVKEEDGENGDNDNAWTPHNSASDNQSLSSFPLLSTNAKQGFHEDALVSPPPPPQEITSKDAKPRSPPKDNNHQMPPTSSPSPAKGKDDSHETDPFSMEYKKDNENDTTKNKSDHHGPSQTRLRTEQHRSSSSSYEHRRDHPQEAAAEVETSRRYLSSDQQQKSPNKKPDSGNHEVNRNRPYPQDPKSHLTKSLAKQGESLNERPRAVRFATKISEDLGFGRDASEEIPFDEEDGGPKESPTSVTNFDDDPDSSKNSALAPKNLFNNTSSTSSSKTNNGNEVATSEGKPKSILRKRNTALDDRGRYSASASDPGVGSVRGRNMEPVFTDSRGREVSPIRSKGRRVRVQHNFDENNEPSSQGEQPRQTNGVDPHHADELMSIPSNPDSKCVEVLFDSETDADLALIRKEVSFPSCFNSIRFSAFKCLH